MPLFRRKQDKSKTNIPVTKESVSLKQVQSPKSSPQSPDSTNGDIGIPSNLLNPPGWNKPAKLILSEEALFTEDVNPDHTGLSPRSPMKTSSRLSKTLREILYDKDALHCFIQFMEQQQAEHFIRFWVDADSFRASTLTRMQTHSLQTVGRSALLKRRTETRSRNVAERNHNHSQLEEKVCGNISCVATVYEENTVGEYKGEVLKGNSNGGASNASLDSDGTLSCLPCCGNSPPEMLRNQNKHRNGVTAKDVRAGKSFSLPLTSGSDQAKVTFVSLENETNLTIGNTGENLPCITATSHSSLQDSGIGELVSLSSSHSENPGDNDSVDTLIDEVADDHSEKRSGEDCLSLAVSTDGNDTAVQSVGTVSGAENQARAVISKSDICGEEEINDSAVKQMHSFTVEELREKIKKSIERDAVTIFTKYIAKDAPHPIGVDDTLREETIRRICREDKQVDPECFVACQNFVVKYMEKTYHKPFTDSEFHCKHQVKVLTSGQVYLADILYNELALCYFMEFMEQEAAQHIMQFWMAADNFQQQLIQQDGGYDGMQAQNDAMILYDRFFSLQATTPLGFDDKIRFEVESNICRESGPLPDCFSKPRDIILQNLEKVYFSRYLSSEIYYRYLSDLVNTVEMAQDLPVRRHRRQASDASSEHSSSSHSTGTDGISTRNTLLATGSRNTRKVFSMSSGTLISVVGKIEEHLSTMDTDFLNPEDLWKQPNKGPLRLGSMNSLGQFVSEFDPDPDGGKKKSGGFFKKNKSKEKEQEEMAVQVAQMILKDVANMTQMGDACARTGNDNHSSNNTGLTTTSSLHVPSSTLQSTFILEPPPS